MKNLLKLFGVFSLVFVIGFLMISCDNGDQLPEVSIKIIVANSSSNHTITGAGQRDGIWKTLNLASGATSEELGTFKTSTYLESGSPEYGILFYIEVDDGSEAGKLVGGDFILGKNKPPSRIGFRYDGTELKRDTQLE